MYACMFMQNKTPYNIHTKHTCIAGYTSQVHICGSTKPHAYRVRKTFGEHDGQLHTKHTHVKPNVAHELSLTTRILF